MVLTVRTQLLDHHRVEARQSQRRTPVAWPFYSRITTNDYHVAVVAQPHIVSGGDNSIEKQEPATTSVVQRSPRCGSGTCRAKLIV